MKKKWIGSSMVIVFVVAIAGIVLKYNHKQQVENDTYYGLIERKGAAANTPEWKTVQENAAKLIAAIKADPNDTRSAIKLVALLIEEARVTGNFMYYDRVAMKYDNDILRIEPANFYALVFKALIYLSQHHFADGLATAKEARAVIPANPYVYGLLVDGSVEMGYYDSAVAYGDKMVSIRPDLTSYSRISYLREIFGDYPGAIKAMTMAVETGGAGDEHTEWTRTQLAHLYEKTGDFKKADSLYRFSLSLRPNYAYAMAGLARIALANNDYKTAINYYLRADSIVNDNTLKEELAEVYALNGQQQISEDMTKEVIDELTKDSQASSKDQTIGHYSDRELAYAYLKLKENDKALDHAMQEYNRRPENIDVNETVAWVYYNMGDYEKALPYIGVALKTKSKNPVLLTRASLIYYKAGNKQLAKTLLDEASPGNSYVGKLLQQETKNVIQNLYN